MEAFRLLSRSTNLKPASSSKDGGAPHIPSEGGVLQAKPTTDGWNGIMLDESTTARKRKRHEPVPIHGPVDGTLIDADGQAVSAHRSTNRTPSPASRRTAPQGGSRANEQDVSHHVSEEECRSIFKSHKVKISALTGDLIRARSTASLATASETNGYPSVDQPSRKKHKEASQLYTQPLTSFHLLTTRYCGPRTLLHNIHEQGYRAPTEIQLATIPLLLDPTKAGLHLPPGSRDIDLLSVAPTGSGKTLAFLAPLIHKILQERHQAPVVAPSRRFSALIIAPTKELVAQIVNEGRKLCIHTGVSITAVRKGMHLGIPPEAPSLDTANREQSTKGEPYARTVVKTDILVTTPLLLQNIVEDNQAELSSIRHLVLDEADVLLDPLFRDQTLSGWNACTNPSLRINLWSATIGSNIEELVIQVLNQRSARLGIHPSNPLLRCVIGLKDSALPTISHRLVYAATEPGKLLGLRQLLHPTKAIDGRRPSLQLRPPFLVFTQTIERAVALHSELLYDIPSEAGGSSRIAVLHSGLSDSTRSESMARFRKGQIWILITTDLLSRGVDFRGVNGVVNYDIPNSTAAYVHRVGRTGRAGREGGMAVTFYTREDIKYVKAIANAIAVSEKARDGRSNSSDQDRGVQTWLLNALPDICKRDRQELKKRGVDVRRRIRTGEDEQKAKAKRKSRISTKSGYERRVEHKRKGAIAGRQVRVEDGSEDDDMDGNAWSGFD